MTVGVAAVLLFTGQVAKACARRLSTIEVVEVERTSYVQN